VYAVMICDISGDLKITRFLNFKNTFTQILSVSNGFGDNLFVKSGVWSYSTNEFRDRFERVPNSGKYFKLL
jgi:hypothetical protein